MRKTIALCIAAAWTLLAGVAFADALEDAQKVSAREDQTVDRGVQQALSTPAVKPAHLSYTVIKPRPAFESSQRIACHSPWFVLPAIARPLALTLLDPSLTHRFKLFQFFSVYRL